MTHELISEALAESAGLRMPVFEDGVPGSEKIGQLESYLLLTAFGQGKLSEERLGLYADLRDARKEWSELVGFEALVKRRTDTAVDEAKAQLRPDLHQQVRDLEWKVKRLTEEIDRLERDATKCSRVYTFITGS